MVPQLHPDCDCHHSCNVVFQSGSVILEILCRAQRTWGFITFQPISRAFFHYWFSIVHHAIFQAFLDGFRECHRFHRLSAERDSAMDCRNSGLRRGFLSRRGIFRHYGPQLSIPELRSRTLFSAICCAALTFRLVNLTLGAVIRALNGFRISCA